MEIEAQAVITKLAEQVAEQAITIAQLRAVVDQLQGRGDVE